MGWRCRACGSVNVAGTRFCGHCGVAAAVEGPPGPVSSAEELRLVTVLFADLAGFTSLAESLDAERLVEVIDPLLSLMSEVITRFGGTVTKYAGDAVLAFFGVPATHDDDALRAVLAAWELRREVDRHVAGLDGPAGKLAVHIGINTGHVVTGMRLIGDEIDHAVLGDAVNVAQRLEAAAPPGEIYVGELTQRMSGHAVGFDAIGELAVKGKRDAVLAWRVRDAVSATDSLGAPPTAPMAGRARQMSAVGDALAQMRTRQAGCFVGIVGEAGVGKTRLVAAARDDDDLRRQCRWLSGRCVSYGATLPYRPFIDLLYDVASVSRDAPTERLVAALAALLDAHGLTDELPYLLQLVGGAAAAPLPAAWSPEALRHRVHQAVVALVVGLSARDPIVVAIEDVHWIDPASRDLLRVLTARSRDARFAVLATARPEGREVMHGLAAASAERLILELPRLDRESIREVVTGIFGGSVSDALLELVIEHTSGNPLFVEELCRSMVAHAQVEPSGDGWRPVPGLDAVGVPPTIEAVIAARIDLLPADASSLLQAAAVIGREVPLALLRGLTGLDAKRADALLQIAVEGGFVDPASGGDEERITFHHALIVKVAYSRLLRRNRTELHQRCARTIVEIYGDDDDVVDVLAHHARHGNMGIESLDYLVRAADRAASLFANREALAHLEGAIELCAGRPELSSQLGALLLDKGALHARLGEFDDSLDNYRQASSQDPVRAAVGTSQALRKLGRYAEAAEVLAVTEAAGHLSVEAQGSLARERGMLAGANGDAADAVRVLEEGLRHVEGSGTALEALVRVDLARSLELLERHDEALSHAERAVELLEQAGEVAQLPTALRVCGGILHDVSDAADGCEQASRMLERALRAARDIGHAEEEAAALVNLGQVRKDQGLPDDAMNCFGQALDAFERIDVRAGVACVYANMAEVLGSVCRWQECEEAAAAGLAVAREIDHKFWITGCLIGLSQALLGQGRLEQAAVCASEAIAEAEHSGMPGRQAAAARTLDRVRAAEAAGAG